MIDESDAQLVEWVQTLVGNTQVVLTPPTDTATGMGISVYLMSLASLPPASGTRRAPLQLALRYLVSAWADREEDAHKLLSQVVFAAMDNEDFAVDLDSVTVETWKAFNVVPRPAFFLRIPARLERQPPPVKYVRSPLEVRIGKVASLRGTVLGPGDIPIVGAMLELPAEQISCYTDSNGRFQFGPVADVPPVKTVLIRAKGRELSMDISTDSLASQPLVIRFDPLTAREI